MDFFTVLFWIAFVIVFWLGFRNIIVIISGSSQSGRLKPGQRLCHIISLIIYWLACLFSLLYHSFLPFIFGVVIELLLRRSIIRSGNKAYRLEFEMILAVRTNNINKVNNLIEQGADINFHDSRMEGVTALHEASRKGNVEILNFLLQNGADIHSMNHNGFTPLHIAAYCGENMTVSTLIKNGADVNAKAKENLTPLHTAAVRGNIDTVELLINNGADPLAYSSKDNATPIDFAKREGHQDVVNLLSKK